MKKLLLTSVAMCGVAMIASPAYANVELNLGGFFKGYGAYVDQDEEGTLEVNGFDIIRQTEVHFGGETTLDNGLTVGMHIEAEADGPDTFNVDESYAYFSGGWGRVNFGDEDGAAYLLQVAAPSADTNIDGIRQYVQPVNYTVAGGTNLTAVTGGLDYDMDIAGKTSKLTYLTPIMSGFQGGVSFTPDNTDATGLAGIGQDDVVSTFGRGYEVGVRYEGMFNNVGVIAGAGYAQNDLEDGAAVAAGIITDDRTTWNAGIDLDIGPFGIGAAYVVDDHGEVQNAANTGAIDDEKIIVVGADYTTGPFKLGVSYYDADNSFGLEDVDSKRYSGGVVYTYGPGMTLRGSVAHVKHDGVTGLASGDEIDATSVVIGTQINF